MAAVIPFTVAELLEVITLINSALGLAVDIKGLLQDPSAGLETIKDKLDTIDGHTSGLSGTLSDLQDTLIAKLTRIEDATGAIEDKVSTIQQIMTGAQGFLNPPDEYPTLDLRSNIAAVQHFAPGDGGLFAWLSYLTRATPPTMAGGARFLGHAAGAATFNVPECWAVRLTATDLPAGAPPSNHPLAPVYEFLGRVSFQTYGGWTEAQKISHPTQLFWTGPIQPSQIAIEAKSGTEFDVHAIMPVGFI